MELGEELWQQFRAVANERLERIEAAWTDVLGSLDERAAALIHRELHTLKGESNLLGMTDVGLICSKLEDLLEVARGRGYAVDDDFDLVVSMAVRFMAVLVRRKTGSRVEGIDLPAFVRQIDSLLAELRPEPRRVAMGTLQSLKVQPMRGLVPASLRARLAPFAVDAFIEYAMARGPRRDRLRASWHGLRDLIGIQRAMVGPAQLANHIAGALALARELDKLVDIAVDLTSVEATADILAAVNTAVVHLLRNAIDHGIEPPAERRQRAKHERGKIRIRSNVAHDMLHLHIEDDGRGVSLERVRDRAVELGLIAHDADVTQRWFELVCRPSFSTRPDVGDVSGRGVGLDAVRTSIVELGGTLAATTGDAGTCWSISIPLFPATVEGHVFRVPGLPFPIVVDATWIVAEPPATTSTIDLAHELGFPPVSGGAPPHYFMRGDAGFAIWTDQRPEPATARRVVAAQSPVRAEVIVVDGSEGLLLRDLR